MCIFVYSKTIGGGICLRQPDKPMDRTIRSIILTDDDEDDRDIFRSALQSIHPDVVLHTFADGEELRAFLCHEPTELPHLVFLDINMPRLNGFECLAMLRERFKPQELPVVMYTTSNDRADQEKAARLGANLYARKPSDYKELKNLINRVLAIDWQERIVRRDGFVM